MCPIFKHSLILLRVPDIVSLLLDLIYCISSIARDRHQITETAYNLELATLSRWQTFSSKLWQFIFTLVSVLITEPQYHMLIRAKKNLNFQLLFLTLLHYNTVTQLFKMLTICGGLKFTHTHTPNY